MNKQNKIYCCFSMNLKNFLSDNGIRYEIEALSKSTHKTFWVYIVDDKLNQLLTQWSTCK